MGTILIFLAVVGELSLGLKIFIGIFGVLFIIGEILVFLAFWMQDDPDLKYYNYKPEKTKVKQHSRKYKKYEKQNQLQNQEQEQQKEEN